METADNKTQGELKLQLTELEDELALLTLAHEYLGQNIVKRLLKKLVMIFIELSFYGIFVSSMVALVWLHSFVPFQFETILSESATLKQTVDIKEVNAILFVSKTMLFLFSVFNLILGLVFRKLRRKNNKLQDAADIFESLINLTKDKMKRIESRKV